jgi:cysteine synthase A
VPNILNREVLDGVVQVSKDEAFSFAQRAAREEGLLVGVSSGAALAAVAKKLPEIPKGATVLTYCYDTGERYLSIEGLF